MVTYCVIVFIVAMIVVAIDIHQMMKDENSN